MAEAREQTARRAGPDRVAVGLFSLAGFLVVLALLGAQAGGSSRSAAHPRAVLLRRVYDTTVVERVIGAGSHAHGGGTSESQTIGPPSGGAPAAAVTRVS